MGACTGAAAGAGGAGTICTGGVVGAEVGAGAWGAGGRV
jgi:hypothetical protein